MGNMNRGEIMIRIFNKVFFRLGIIPIALTFGGLGIAYLNKGDEFDDYY